MLCTPSCCEMDNGKAGAPVPGDGGGRGGGQHCRNSLSADLGKGSPVVRELGAGSCGKLLHGREPVHSSYVLPLRKLKVFSAFIVRKWQVSEAIAAAALHKYQTMVPR